MSNNVYIDDYTRIMNKISFNEENFENLVNAIEEKYSSPHGITKKQLAIAAVMVTAVAVGIKCFINGEKIK